MLILTFLAILSGAGLALAWFLVAPPVLERLAASGLGRVLRSRAVIALLLVVPFGAVAAVIAINGEALRSAAPAPAPQRADLQKARQEAPHDLEAAIKQLEAKLAKDPNDADGWRLLERSYAELGNTAKAAEAARRAAALGGGSAEADSQRGEDLVTAANGAVGPDARAAFTAALKADPGDPRARFFMGLAAAQDGKSDDALQSWLALEHDSPPDAPWLQGLRANIDRLAKEAGVGADEIARRRSGFAAANPARPGAAAPGPTASDVAAAQTMTEDDRTAMIKAMVQRLADRLQQEPKDVDGWMRLGRAYGVLGEREKSLDAYRHASEADPTREDARQALTSARSAMGAAQ